ncbi:MAG TPA: hypothetical protein VHG69_06700 [Thermoleophilaceae bacterium]|nr:hypothetical protein [Thermoleophilaceae bacterium]
MVATLALFVALGGSSYAALRVTSKNVPKNALTGADIKKLTGADVTNNSLTGADVKNLGSGDISNGRLLAEDFKAGELPKGDKGDPGLVGPPGPTFGSISGTDPTANPDFVAPPSSPTLRHTFTTPSPGRLLAIAQFERFGADCSGGADPFVGLYVDGAPVPATERFLFNNVTEHVSMAGVTSTALPAGNHTAALGVTCAGSETPNVISTNDEGRTIGAILLGG